MKLWLVLAAASALEQGGSPDPAPLAQPEPQPTTAAGAGGAGVIPYPASFFALARPNNAFEMLQRVPGFTFDGGDAEVRGFASALGNVLIDGQRPSSKSVTLEAQLRRIPTSAVDRIELIRGGAPGIDMQGQPLIANVVRFKTAASTLTATGGVRFFPDGRLMPQADLEWSRQSGRLTLEASARAIYEMDPESGDGTLTRRTPSGALLESGPFRHREPVRTLSANAAAALASGADLLRLNSGVRAEDKTKRQTLVRTDTASAASQAQQIFERRRERGVEVGGDYQHNFDDQLSARFVALQTLDSNRSVEQSEEPGETVLSDQGRKSGESILRASLARRTPTLTLEAGAEGAFNFLNADTALAVNGADVALPNANVRVEEKRGEVFASAFWKPSDRLSLEAALRTELSEISQSGDSTLAKTFFFPKPRVVLSYAPTSTSQLRLRLEREVGQLDFGDFAASTELAIGTVVAGNADLGPESSWVIEAAYERRFWDKGAAVITFTHAEVRSVVDLIPVAGRFDAPGNLGSGRRDTVKLTLTLPLDRLGIAGGLVTTEGTWRWSQVTDPVTGKPREISNLRPFEGRIRFSQDVARLRSTWGIDGDFAYSETQYRIDEIRRLEVGTYWTLYWDYKPSPSLSVRAELQNFSERAFGRVRTLYSGPRSIAPVQLIERRSVDYSRFAYIRIRKML